MTRTATSPMLADARRKPSSERQIVLVLQGGGALGAYQAGVYQALHEAGIEPDWIIGTSIGAINASLIAGNPRRRAPATAARSSGSAWRIDRRSALPAWTGMPDTIVVLEDAAPRHPGVLRAQSRRVPRHARAARRRQRRLLLDRAAGKDAAASWSTSRSSTTCEPRLTVGAAHVRTSADALLRQPRQRARRQAHHGVRRAAAGVSRRCASTASSIGTAASSPTRRPRRSSTTTRARTR